MQSTQRYGRRYGRNLRAIQRQFTRSAPERGVRSRSAAHTCRHAHDLMQQHPRIPTTSCADRNMQTHMEESAAELVARSRPGACDGPGSSSPTVALVLIPQQATRASSGILCGWHRLGSIRGSTVRSDKLWPVILTKNELVNHHIAHAVHTSLVPPAGVVHQKRATVLSHDAVVPR